MAEVNDKGEVTVEGEFVGRLEGFRFSPDKSAVGAESKVLKSASEQALAPQFHLRADRFYNAPDTEIDYTDQGGLMWGENAVGKLTAGPELLKPKVEVFVDEAAGAEVAQKVQRRLQHFVDRKIAALFEPLLDLQRDETLTGLARGFAFRMVEAFGILPRGAVAQEVKELDQDARGALRKHGIRFGQFTIFMPLLLKPAPTRLRLLLWSLAQGLQDFPEAPPPGLVTVPVVPGAPHGYDSMCGYRNAGERSIRIDMLERLADMLRTEDSRGGFEAKADMLSITGMTLEQFADLMQGLGYRAQRGERKKVKAAPAPQSAGTCPEAAGTKTAEAAETETETETESKSETTPLADQPSEASEAADTPNIADAAETPVAEAEVVLPEMAEPVAEMAEAAPGDPAQPEADKVDGKSEGAGADADDIEIFYTFNWQPRGNRPNRSSGDRSRRAQQGGGQKVAGERPQGKGKRRDKRDDRAQSAKTYSARPQRPEKKIDPDNPFAAALMGLKDDSQR